MEKSLEKWDADKDGKLSDSEKAARKDAIEKKVADRKAKREERLKEKEAKAQTETPVK